MTKEQDRTMQALQTAIQMEIDGKAYYLKASRDSGNPMGKKLLESLAAEEDIHRAVFEKIFKSIQANEGWPEKTDFKPDGGQHLRTIFDRESKKPPAGGKAPDTELNAVEQAMSMENKTYDYYIAQGQKASPGAEKDFYEALAAQEKEHHAVLLDYFEYLKDPAAWFVEKEHPSLDGG